MLGSCSRPNCLVHQALSNQAPEQRHDFHLPADLFHLFACFTVNKTARACVAAGFHQHLHALEGH